MTHAEIRLEVERIVREVFQRSDLILEADTAPRDVRGWDSFKTVEIIIALQEHFEIEFDDAELDQLRNFGDLVRIVDSQCCVAKE